MWGKHEQAACVDQLTGSTPLFSVRLWSHPCICSHCSSSAGAQHRSQRSAHTGNDINMSSIPYIEVLRGRDGRDGRDGVPGPRGPQGQKGDQGVAGPPGPRNGGVVYTRWGKSSCPNVTGTELVYAGRAGGSWYSHTGGDDPDYLAYQPGVQGFSPVYGAEYQTLGGPLHSVHDHNIPCAVCYTSTRVAVKLKFSVQQPGLWSTPATSCQALKIILLTNTTTQCLNVLTRILTVFQGVYQISMVQCSEATCTGILCPPFDPQKELTCVK